jgi:putative ATP-dependent endonuclease of OLD family
MIVHSLHARNFQSILDESLDLDSLTVLVGRNGAGKSAFLRALEMFYDPRISASPEDHYAGETDAEIEIAVTFTDLTAEEVALFGTYLDGDHLTVARVLSATAKKSGSYHGMRLQNSDFATVRAAGSKTEIRTSYSELRTTDKYLLLPPAKSADQAEAELTKWEVANPTACQRMRDDGQFFGFTGVAQGYLGRHTRFIRIPAVRDASGDATEGRGSCVTEILDLVVRSRLASRKDFVALRDETQKRYRDLMDPAKLTELTTLQEQLTETLRIYAPEADVGLEWAKLVDIDLPLPKAEVRLNEDGYRSSVERTGHGLQRAFILTMLQHLVVAKGAMTASDEHAPVEAESRVADAAPQPGLVLAIEEPELYQHPSRQRHMASILLKLAEGSIPGVATRTQVLYTTHSALFVGLDRFAQIRRLSKCDNGPKQPRITKAVQASLHDIAEELWIADGKKGDMYTAATLRARCQAIMTPWMNEGFFADLAVLVEGEGDRAAILGMAGSMGHSLESLGISVIPCGGKSSLDRPLVIFRRMGIPVYVVWDGDHGKPKATPDGNRRLLQLLHQPQEDWPSVVADGHACFQVELENTLASELGNALFEALLAAEQLQLGIPKREQALKNPVVLTHIIEQASEHGHTSATLRCIVERILKPTPAWGNKQ